MTETIKITILLCFALIDVSLILGEIVDKNSSGGYLGMFFLTGFAQFWICVVIL